MSAVAIFGLTGQSAVVTGGACGIGRGVAEPLAAGAGANAGLAPEDETLAAVKVLGRTGVALHLNMSRRDEVAQFADVVRSNFNAVAVLVKNAGVHSRVLDAPRPGLSTFGSFGIAVHPIAPCIVHSKSTENGSSPGCSRSFRWVRRASSDWRSPEDLTLTALVPRRRRFRPVTGPGVDLRRRTIGNWGALPPC